MADELLRVSTFSTASLPPAGQFAAWRANISAMFDASPRESTEPSAFPAEARTYHLGTLVIGDTRFPAQRYTRDRHKISSDGIDLFLVRLHLAGGHVGTNGDKMVEARAGDIDVIDMAQPLAYEADASTLIVMGIPRPIIEAALPDARALHGLVLRGDRALGALLADCLRSLTARLPDMTMAEANGVATATMAMIAACLRPSYDRITASDSAAGGAGLTRVKQYIEENLRSRDLTTEALCAQFRLSRASLYRLFGESGGIQRYIRDRRLVRIFMALADPVRQRRSIGEIAFSWGFVSEAHFARVFRRAFGCTPGEARDIQRMTRAVNDDEASDCAGGEPLYADWLRRLATRDR